MRIGVGQGTLPPPASPLSDHELERRARDLIWDYKRQLGLEDWHTVLMFDPELFVVGHTEYAYDKREALITLRTEMVRRDGGAMLAYVCAHEVAHLLLAPLQQIRDRLLIGRSSTYTTLIREEWKWTDETAAHRIAVGLGTTAPPVTFWWNAFNDGNSE